MRAQRSARLAEYLSTNALLHHIGLHPTALIERREAAAGVGVYVRDACDAHTTLLVVPSRMACATSVLRRRGAVARLHVRPHANSHTSSSSATVAVAADEVDRAWRELDDGLLTHLTSSGGEARAWVEWCWRTALERHRVYSPWWGWLQSLPTPDELASEREGALQQCCAQLDKSNGSTMSCRASGDVARAMRQQYDKARARIVDEVWRAHELLASCDNVMPSRTNMLWAADVLLSRGRCVPVCWPHTARDSSSSSHQCHNDNNDKDSAATACDDNSDDVADAADVQAELAVVPFVDLVNGSDDDEDGKDSTTRQCARRCANADVEVATRLHELPAWYTREVCDATAHGDAVLAWLLSHGSYCFCVTLQSSVAAASEVLLRYPASPLCTGGVLDAGHDARLSRLLRYAY